MYLSINLSIYQSICQYVYLSNAPGSLNLGDVFFFLFLWGLRSTAISITDHDTGRISIAIIAQRNSRNPRLTEKVGDLLGMFHPKCRDVPFKGRDILAYLGNSTSEIQKRDRWYLVSPEFSCCVFFSDQDVIDVSNKYNVQLYSSTCYIYIHIYIYVYRYD